MENNLKDVFTKYIQRRIQGRDAVDHACDLKVIDMDFIFGLANPGEHASDLLFEYIFGKEALDWVNWWMYEKNGTLSSSPLEAYDKDGNVIPTDTIDDLWNLIEEYYVDKQNKMGNPK